MSTIVMQTAQLLEALPKKEQQFAYEIVKKLVRAWDPDFTKLTDEEKDRVTQAEKSGFVNENEIDWEQIGLDS